MGDTMIDSRLMRQSGYWQSSLKTKNLEDGRIVITVEYTPEEQGQSEEPTIEEIDAVREQWRRKSLGGYLGA